MINIAIFASGSGSNAENICNYFCGSHSIKIGLIISNRKDAYVLERAKRLGIPSEVFTKDDFCCSDKIIGSLQDHRIDFIVLAGFLLKIPQNILDKYPGKIINIHPALLPKFGGKGMYGDKVHQAVKAAGESESGITIHYVNENYDEGQIIFQARCRIEESDSAGDIADKVHALEYEYFPKTIETVILQSASTNGVSD